MTIYMERHLPSILKGSATFIYITKLDSLGSNDDVNTLETIKSEIKLFNPKLNNIDFQNFIAILNKIDTIPINDKNGLEGLRRKVKLQREKNFEIKISNSIFPYYVMNHYENFSKDQQECSDLMNI